MSRIDRATLGVDGNAAFALLGENIQEGECEFVVIECGEPRWTTAWQTAASRAATKAYRTLQARIGRPISYRLDPSHPRFV